MSRTLLRHGPNLCAVTQRRVDRIVDFARTLAEHISDREEAVWVVREVLRRDFRHLVAEQSVYGLDCLDWTMVPDPGIGHWECRREGGTVRIRRITGRGEVEHEFDWEDVPDVFNQSDEIAQDIVDVLQEAKRP